MRRDSDTFKRKRKRNFDTKKNLALFYAESACDKRVYKIGK